MWKLIRGLDCDALARRETRKKVIHEDEIRTNYLRMQKKRESADGVIDGMEREGPLSKPGKDFSEGMRVDPTDFNCQSDSWSLWSDGQVKVVSEKQKSNAGPGKGGFSYGSTICVH